MHVGLRLVKDGAADAFVTAGNTGGVLAVATLHSLGRIRGIKRPALTAVFENYTGMTVLTDFGANSDCKPDWLLQFAIMADLYTKLAVGLKEPRIALLSNGEEEGKGNDLVRETHPLMKTLPGINYIGPVEPKEVMMGHTDVVIVDGYVGNIMGKSLEAMGSMIARVIRDEIMKGTLSKVGGMLIRPAMKNVRSKMDPAAEIGGIPLLGLEGLVIVGHGRSNARAIRSAIRQARNAIETQVVEAIREGIS
jgi:glycerol-3-phosphate acyltransferase PlsX